MPLSRPREQPSRVRAEGSDAPELHGPGGAAAFVGEGEPIVRADVRAREVAVAVAGASVVGVVGVEGREFVLGACRGCWTADKEETLKEGRRREEGETKAALSRMEAGGKEEGTGPREKGSRAQSRSEVE